MTSLWDELCLIVWNTIEVVELDMCCCSGVNL